MSTARAPRDGFARSKIPLLFCIYSPDTYHGSSMIEGALGGSYSRLYNSERFCRLAECMGESKVNVRDAQKISNTTFASVRSFSSCIAM